MWNLQRSALFQESMTLAFTLINERQNAKRYEWAAEELEAPSASKKDSLFDWQFENDGANTLNRFGGVEKLMASLGTDPNKVTLNECIHRRD